MSAAIKEVSPELAEIIRRIAAVAEPQKIILFGSSAHESARPGSDFDLLVIKAGDYDAGRLVEEIYMNLLGVGHAVDVVAATPEKVENDRRRWTSVICPAMEEGRLVYAA